MGHVVFAATMIALGILDLVKGDFFTGLWLPIPKDLPTRAVLVYLCAVISLACGMGLLWRRTAVYAARVLLSYLLLWTLMFKAPLIVLHPTVEGVYQNCGENAVLVAGAWVLYDSLATDWDRHRFGFATGESGLRTARVLYGLAMIAFGLSHFAYLELTAPLVPGWLPWHAAWAYFTGSTYLAAGAAVLIGVYVRLATTLSALQMGLFTLLVWVPKAVAGDMSAFQWGEFALSWALTSGAWVVADSCRDVAWLAVLRR
jgi:uncharacterized membrane protein